TGQPIASFGTAGRIDLREGLGMAAERATVSASTPGQVFEDLLIMGSSVPETLPGTPGHIRAFDVNTGALRWIFHTIPQPGEFAYGSWPPDAYKLIGGANAWAGVTVDAKNAMVFAATGSASFDFYGVNRHGDNLFANCVLALDAHAAVLQRFRQFGTGMFAPPTERGVIVFPGFDGGAEWGGAAFDPDSALLYVNSNEMPWIVRLIPNNDTSLYNVNCATCHRE